MHRAPALAHDAAPDTPAPAGEPRRVDMLVAPFNDIDAVHRAAKALARE